jgi:hypothetical protein
MRKKYVFGCLLLAIASTASADVLTFEGSSNSWLESVGAAQVTTITFDSIPGSTSHPITGTEFVSFAGGPIFTSVVGDGVYVGKLASDQIPNPPSAPNMLSPSSCSPSCEGVIRLSFDIPMRAVGATFVDVENEFSLTGYSLVPDAPAPTIVFTSAPGDLSFSFLGFVADKPFTSVDIHFTTGSSIDGALLDNLMYAPVPEPETYAMLMTGIGLISIIVRRKQRIA